MVTVKNPPPSKWGQKWRQKRNYLIRFGKEKAALNYYFFNLIVYLDSNYCTISALLKRVLSLLKRIE